MPNTQSTPPTAANNTAPSQPGAEPRLISAVSADGASPQFKIPVSSQAIQSVESVDLDLVLTTTTGEKIILQQGALQAATAPDSKIVFQNGDSITAADQIKKLGVLKPVEGGSFRLKSGDASPAVAELVTGDGFGLGKELQDTMSQLTETSKQLEKVLQTLSTATLSNTADESKAITAGPGTGTGVQKITPQSENKFASPSPGSPPQPEVVENNNTLFVKVNSTPRILTGSSLESVKGVLVKAVGDNFFNPAKSLSQIEFAQIDAQKIVKVDINTESTINVEPGGKAHATLTLPGVLNAKSLLLTAGGNLPEGFTIDGKSFVNGKLTLTGLSSLTDLKLDVGWQVGAKALENFSVGVKFFDETTALDYGNQPLNFYHAATLPVEVLDSNSNPKIFLSTRGYTYDIAGSIRNDSLTGGAGDDRLDGGAGADRMTGGKGNDTYVVDSAADIVDELEGQGTDTVESAINYTLGDNVENLTLTGSATVGTGNTLANTLTANNKGNTLSGGAGADTLMGGTGNDRLDGGIDADSMSGGAGSDTYVVENKDDVVTELAGQGTDTVESAINYTLGRDVENLTLTGKATLGTGNTLANILTANDLGNTLAGGAGVDNLYGGAGDDRLDGGTDADSMSGGAGNDTYMVDNAADVIAELAGQGTDTVESGINYTLGDNVENLTLTGGAKEGTGNTLANTLIANDLGNTLSGGAGADTLMGGAGNDRLDGSTGADSMSGGAGNDTYVIDSAADVVAELQGQGTDTVESAINYTLGDNVENLTLTGSATVGTGNTLANTLTANSSGNTLSGGAGADTLMGGAGNDRLDGGTDADSMSGGAGNDTYVVDNAADVVAELEDQGSDTVESAINFTLGRDVENLTLTGSAEVGTGNTLNNTITGNSGNNVLEGGAGVDTLIGGDGDDTYIVDSTTDIITELATANSGKDTIKSSVTFSLLDTDGAGAYGGNIENLTLTGTAAIDGTGNTLNNTITGNSSNNVLEGGAGVDRLNGGDGDDTYIVDSTTDIITELADAKSGKDTIKSSVTFSLLDTDGAGANGGNIENLTLTGTAAIDGTGNALNNTITGNAGENILIGGGGADQLIGGDGSDTASYFGSSAGVVVSLVNGSLGLDGDAAGDVLSEIENLTGSAHGDSLTGNSGNNVLEGGAGVDTLIGGDGDDTYIVDSTTDIITELATANSGKDTIKSSVTFSLLDTDGAGANGGNIENLTLTGTAAIDGTGNTLNNTITGNSSNNVLEGGAGVDRLNGGDGDDTYIVDSTTDIITELATENSGKDTIKSSVTFSLLDTDGAGANGGNIENLTLTGTAAIDGTGNAFNNSIIGNAGNNTLNGGDGLDTLIGGAGKDSLLGGAGDDILDLRTDNTTLVGDRAEGGEGNDTVIINQSDLGDSGINLDGGTDTDTLRVYGSANGQLDLKALNAWNFEKLDLRTDAVGTTVLLSSDGIMKMVNKFNDVDVLTLQLGSGDFYEIKEEAGVVVKTGQNLINFYSNSVSPQNLIVQVNFENV